MCLKKKPSMRLLIFILPIILIACGNSKRKQGKSPGNLTKEHSKDTLTNKSVQTKDFSNEGGSSIKVGCRPNANNKCDLLNRKLFIDDKLGNYIVKKTHNTITTPEQENIDSKITLDIFALNDGHLVRTISKSAVSVEFSTQFIQTYNNGGCV
jgi:hypothetical protein